MPKGNIYYTLPKADENNLVSTKIANRYKWVDDKDNTITPTWIQLQEKLSSKFGKPIYRDFLGEAYLIMELNASFLAGEVEELMNLGVNKDEPNYTVWEADELRNFQWDTDNIEE